MLSSFSAFLCSFFYLFLLSIALYVCFVPHAVIEENHFIYLFHCDSLPFIHVRMYFHSCFLLFYSIFLLFFFVCFFLIFFSSSASLLSYIYVAARYRCRYCCPPSTPAAHNCCTAVLLHCTAAIFPCMNGFTKIDPKSSYIQFLSSQRQIKYSNKAYTNIE